MAGVSDCFGIGSIVVCTTCFNNEIEGEVLAFDANTKMLILKCSASNGKPELNDVHVINLNRVSNVQLKKEVSRAPEPLQALDLKRLTERVNDEIKKKNNLIKALNAGVSPEGQKLYLTITKTINNTMWQGADIVVLNLVVITPPYRPENVKCIKPDNDIKAIQARDHLKKVVEKHLNDQMLENCQHNIPQ